MWASVQITSGCPAPSSRSKHAVSVGEEIGRKRIYVLGGRSANLPLKDFWKFDPEQQVWEEVRTRGHRPPCLQEHTMVSWKNHMYVFGGEIGFASTGETPLWIFEINTSTWRKMGGSSSHQPSGRRGHSAVVYDDAMFIYGGYQDLRGSSSELWTLDLASETWSMMLVASNLEQPPPRHSHSCVIYDGAMWIYGGLTDLQPRGDFWKWDFDMQEWTRIKVQRGPGELFGHAAVQVMGYMYIFGGERVGVSVNELWRYHFATDTWDRIAAEGAQPPPKCRHVAIANPLLPENGIVMQMKRDSNSGETSFFRIEDDFEMNTNRKPHPPKSLSMCFGQQPTNPHHHHNNQHQDHSGSRKRTFKFRVHPVSRLCSKSTSSDDEDEEEDYLVGYSHSSGQVNLRSLRERISSSRLVRSISSGSYSILHNQSNADTRQFELERLMESKTNQQNNQCRPRLTIQKSQSSDAVLESDCDKFAAAKQLRPRSEVLTESTQSGVPIWVENPNATLSPTSWSDGHQFYSHSNFSHYRPGGLSIVRAGEVHNGSCTTPASRPSRLSYDGPLSTVKDVEEENSENADEANMLVEPKQSNGDSSKDSQLPPANATEMLVDLDVPEVDQERARYPSRFASSYTMSDLNSQTTTPSIESRGMPHSMSHSSGYHSFTDDEGDNHREFAGCLNSSSTTRKGFQRDRELELKTFTPTEADKPSTMCNIGKERARSWDRSYQRKPINRHSFSPGGSITPTSFCGTMDAVMQDKTSSSMTSPTSRVYHNEPSPVERRSRPTSRNSHNPKVEFYPWNLCLYLFGGPEQGAPGVYRQPISIWKLYV